VAACGLTGTDQGADLLVPVQQVPDQRGADLAAATDHQDQRPSSLRHAPSPGPNMRYGPGLIKGESLIGSIRIAD